LRLHREVKCGPFALQKYYHFEPIEVRHGSVVEEHVDSTESSHRKIDKSLAVSRFRQIAWLQGDHRAARSANRCNRRFRIFYI
jgi:hypothetical protein